MALFRKLFYRKPPDGLLEICERIFVFDCCFTTDVWQEENYKAYIGGILGQLKEHFPDASVLVFNFREGQSQSQIAEVLAGYDMTIMEYPRQYEGCPLLTMELIHHCLRSGESWLSLGQRNLLLMHCERGGWPVLSFMLAALLLYRKQYTGEQKTLDMIYRQAPRELLHLLSPLNPIPSQMRYLQYVSRRNVASEWPPLDRALTLDCVILRFIPNFDGEGGCRPVFRIYGQDPFLVSDRTTKVLYSTPKKGKPIRAYKQAECELVKIDVNCHIQGDVVLECISLSDDMEREEMMFRVVFNTAFIRSNILILNRDEIDILWEAKDQFPKDFRAEVLFSEMDAAASVVAVDFPGLEEKEGLPVEAFAKVHDLFNSVDWLDHNSDLALNVLHQLNVSNFAQEMSDTGLIHAVLHSPRRQDSSPWHHHERKKHTGSLSSPQKIESPQSPKLSLDADAGKEAEQQDNKTALQASSQSKAMAEQTPQLTPDANIKPSSHDQAPVVSSKPTDEAASKAPAGQTSFVISGSETLESKSVSPLTSPCPVPPSEQPPHLNSASEYVAPSENKGTDRSLEGRGQESLASPHPASAPPTKPLPSTVPPPSMLPHLSATAPLSRVPPSSTVPASPTVPPPSTPPPPPPPPLMPTSKENISIKAGPPIPPTPPRPPTPPVKENRNATAGPSPPPPPPLSSGKAASPNTSSPMPPPPQPPSSSNVPPPPPIGKDVPKTGNTSSPAPPTPAPPFSSPLSSKGRLSRTISSKNQQSKKLKPLHWLKLSRAVQGSLWAEAQKSGEASKAPEIDMSELENLFSAAVPNSDCGGKPSTRGSRGPKTEKVQLIDHRRAYNCEIMLSKVKVPLHELMNSVLVLEDSALDIDHVENIIKFCPTKEEMELLKGYTGEKDKLGKCEQFFLELMKVPRVESKLRVFAFKMQFHSQVSDLRSSLNVVNSAAEEIRNSAKLKRIMQTILSLGNALNQGTARGAAIGFRLDSLLKLTETRARNTKMTLMHYLCKVLSDKLPELLDFSKDLASMEPASKIQLKFLAEEMQAINKGLEKVVQELSTSENDGLISENFRKNLKEFLRFAEAEVRSLASLYSGVGRNVDALILYFGEDPARCPFEQVVSTLLNFMRMFNKAHDENCKQLEMELKKSAESDKSKLGASQKDSGCLLQTLV